MRRQSIFVLALPALLAVLAIVTIWTQIVPKYQARAEVRIRPIIPVLVFRTEDNGIIPNYESFVNTQGSIMKSTTVLQRVLDEREVQETQWYKNSDKSLKRRLWANQLPPLERLRETLKVRPRCKTEITDVTFMDPNAIDARIILDAVLDQYMRYVAEASDWIKEELYRRLVEQYQSLEREILGREKIAAELRKSLGTPIPQELVASERVRLSKTQARFSELRQRIAILEWEVKQANAEDSNDVEVDTTGRKEDQLALLKRQEQLLLAEYEKQKTEFEELFETALLLEEENTALQHKRDLFDAVRQRLDQKNLERNVPGAIEVLTNAFVPSQPHSDRRIMFTVIALVLCLGMGRGIVFLMRAFIGQGKKNQ